MVPPMGNVLTPDTATLCKLGSIVVHAEELLSPFGHTFDKHALDQLLSDPDVKQWLKGMRKLALIPEKRNG